MPAARAPFPSLALTWTSTRSNSTVIGCFGSLAGSFLHGHDGTGTASPPGRTAPGAGEAAFKAAPTRRHRPGPPCLADGERALVEDEAARTASAPPVVAPRQVLERAHSPGRNDGMSVASTTALVRARSKPSFVPSRSIESTGSRRHRGVGTRQPSHRIEAGPLAPAVGVDLPTAVRPLPRVDGDHHALGAELVGELGDEQWALDGGGVDRHFVGTGTQEPARVPRLADAPPTVKGMNTCSRCAPPPRPWWPDRPTRP